MSAKSNVRRRSDACDGNGFTTTWFGLSSVALGQATFVTGLAATVRSGRDLSLRPQEGALSMRGWIGKPYDRGIRLTKARRTAPAASGPAEFISPYQLRTKYEFIFGLGNDEIGYLISKAEWDEEPPWLKNAAEPGWKLCVRAWDQRDSTLKGARRSRSAMIQSVLSASAVADFPGNGFSFSEASAQESLI